MEEDHIRQEAGGDARGPADGDQVWPMEERVLEVGGAPILLNLLSLLRQTAGMWACNMSRYIKSCLWTQLRRFYVRYILHVQASVSTSITCVFDSF